MTVSVGGFADGAHRLFVYGGRREHGCGIENVEAPQQEATLTPTGGEAIPAGSFERHYAAVPAVTGRYVVCAYLYAAPARFPDAWEVGCFWVPEGECYESTISPAGILSAEELARKIVAEEEQKAREQNVREDAERKAREEAVASQAEQEAERKAREAAARCHVPNLRGHTLTGVRRLLKAAHCRLGKVRRPHHSHGITRVTNQAPRRGLTLRPNAAVSITLSTR